MGYNYKEIMGNKIGDVVELKRPHPCGSSMWEIVKIGLDIKLRCCQCHRIIIMERGHFQDNLVGHTEYSCAMKSHFRKSGNQMSGKWKSSCASLLA